MPMNEGLQAHTIQQKFEGQGISDFDVKAQIDKSLTLPENIENLKKQGYLQEKEQEKRPAHIRDQIVKAQNSQAIERMMQRNKTAIEADLGKTAEQTFKPPLSEEEFAKWIADPNKYDIEGVDTADDMKKVELGFEL